MDWMIPILAQDHVGPRPVEPSALAVWTESLLQNAAGAAVFGLLGVALFALAYFALRKCARFSIEKEIAEDQNVALGIVMGSIMLGIAIIVAAAIH